MYPIRREADRSFVSPKRGTVPDLYFFDGGASICLSHCCASSVSLLAHRGGEFGSLTGAGKIMTEQSKAESRETSQRVSRRTLATGSAATLAWSVPMVISTEAQAVGYCTPKCYPDPWLTKLQFTLFWYCYNPDGTPVNGQGENLFVYVNPDDVGAVCNCTGTQVGDSVPVAINTYGTSFKLGNTDLTVTPRTITVDGKDRVGFVLSKSGAMNQGTLTGCVRVVVQCRDRDGDTLYSYCDMTVTFTSDPGGGACGTKQTLQTGSPVQKACGTSCNTAPSTTPKC